MSIHVLDDATINKIAAGEVIDRPSSALKELLENSADSGADRIEVQFEEGGKKRVQVIDNGSGIKSHELPLALQRHATSKINKIEDLFNLSSFGFRGEALASIGAVSELTLSSTQKGAELGAEIKAEGGKLSEVRPSAPLVGTQVEIKNLFYNVPARQKFLKSSGGETAAIKKVFKNFALSHPEIQLSLKQDGKQVLFYAKQDFLKRSSEVLEVPQSECFLLESYEEISGFKLKAVLVHPKLNLSTLVGLSIFVQSRPVQDKLIQQAVIEGYRNLIMEHQFPQAIICLTVSPEFVDINVHPSKLQVKFQRPSDVFKFISHEIKKLFAEKLEQKISPVDAVFEPIAYQPELIRDAVIQYNQKDFVKTEQVTKKEVREETPKTWTALQVIGQFANTYLLTQSKRGLIIIDQHAAHERILFERLKHNNVIEKQVSLLEELIELDTDQVEVLCQEQWQSELLKMGFEYHQRGPTTISISTKPAFLADSSLSSLFKRVSEQIVEAGQASVMRDVVYDIWASMSCHGAIRAGRVLSESEMQSLLAQMEEQPFSSFCPHGRPVSVQLDLNDLEKLFKRIV